MGGGNFTVDTAAETENIAQLVQVEVADDVEIGSGFDDPAPVATESDPAIPFGTYTLELMDGEHFTFRVVAGKNQLDGKLYP